MMVVGRAACTAAAADSLAQFSQGLVTSRSSDRWLEERLASSSGREGARLSGVGGHACMLH